MAEEPSCSEAATAREAQTVYTYSNCTINAAVMSQGNQATTGVDVSNMIVGGSHVTEHRADLSELQPTLKMTAKQASSKGDYKVLENGIFGFYKTYFLCERSNVYLGEQICEDFGTQTRAIKFVQKNKNTMREAQILVKLGSHVNVVSLIHAGIHHADPYDYIYIVMELSWTRTVRDMLEECIKLEKPFYEFIAWSLVEQLMRAVEFLHLHYIIHRDLKPDNVLASDNWTLFKVTDFGLSKGIKDGISTIQTNDNTGTGGYCSRETYSLNAKITAKVDIFSAGVTIAEIMANGKHPFGEDPDLWKHNIKKNKNLNLSHLCVVNKDQVISLIEPMLETDPERRPTAKAVLDGVSRHFQTFQQITTDESSATTSKAITPLSITEKVNAIIMFNWSDKHLYSYKPSTKEWNQMQEFPEDQTDGLLQSYPVWFTPVVSGEHIYIIQDQKFQQLNYSDPAAEWKEMSRMREDHGSEPPAAMLNGLIYVCGKGGRIQASQSVERYDAAQNRWDKIGDMNIARCHPCVVASEDSIYCMGGEDKQCEPLQSVERFDNTLNKWRFVESSPRPIKFAGAAVVKNRIYVADDYDVLCYDIQKNSWSEMDLTKHWPFIKVLIVKILAVDEELYIIGYISRNKSAIYLLKPETEQMSFVKEFKGKGIDVRTCLAVNL